MKPLVLFDLTGDWGDFGGPACQGIELNENLEKVTLNLFIHFLYIGLKNMILLKNKDSKNIYLIKDIKFFFSKFVGLDLIFVIGIPVTFSTNLN